MPNNTVANSFHTRKLCSKLSSSKSDNTVDGKRQFCGLEPHSWGLGATYDDHLRLIGKCVADFLLESIELFSRGVMAEVLRAKIRR